MSIARLLSDCGNNAEKCRQLAIDPDAVLAEYDLSPEHSTAIKKTVETGDPDHVMHCLASSDDLDVGPYVNVNII